MTGLDFRTLFLNFIFTIVLQLGPILLYRYQIHKRPLTSKKAKKVAVVYEIVQAVVIVGVQLLLFVILPQEEALKWSGENVISFAPFLLYGYICYRILQSGYTAPEEELPEIVADPIGENQYQENIAEVSQSNALPDKHVESADNSSQLIPIDEEDAPVFPAPDYQLSTDDTLAAVDKAKKRANAWMIAALISAFVIFVFVVLACSGVFIPRSKADAQADIAYTQGLEKGTEEGKDLGYSTGLSDGYKQGESEGYKTGEKSGKTAGYREASEQYENKISILMDKLKEPYPETGKIFFASTEDRYAPLEIHNPTDDAYFFKVFSDDGETKKDTLAFFVAPQSTAELTMPLGNYRIKYAFGSGDWYGEKMLFGENTQTAIFKDFFSFTVDDSSYWGHILTLQTSQTGNLDSELLGLEEF